MNYRLRPTDQLVAVQLLIQALTYGYYALLARWLLPAELNTYIAFTAFFAIYSVLGLGIQQLAAQKSALGQNLSLKPHNIIGLTLIGLLLAPLLAVVLRLPWFWLVGLALCTPAYTLLSAWRGRVLINQPQHLMVNFLFEHGSKLLLTPVLFLVVQGQAAAMALLVSLLVASLHAWRVSQVTPWHVEQSVESKQATTKAHLFFGFTFLQLLASNLDLLLAQAFLSPEALTNYNQAALLARVMLFVGISAAQANTKLLIQHPGFVWRLAGQLCAILGVYVLGIVLFGGVALNLMYGSKNLSSGSLLDGSSHLIWVVLVLAAGFVALGAAFLQVALLSNQARAIFGWLLLVVFQVFVAILWHQSALQLALGMALVAKVWLVTMVYIHRKGEKHVLRKIYPVA
jgi:O-antigen/teichoic acid export membrane protein